MTMQLARKENQPVLPPILAGRLTPDVKKRVEEFSFSVASIFESWVHRRQSLHTQRAYREDVMSFVKFLGLTWPEYSPALLGVAIQDVLGFRTFLLRQECRTENAEPPYLLALELL